MTFRNCFRWLLILALVAAVASPAFAQSQAINGTIEGTVKDSSGGVLPGVTVTITNTDTGTQRVVVTNSSGIFRAPLLPLGAYSVTFELSGFSKLEKSGITLSAGQTAVLNESMTVGSMTETVKVTAESDVVDLGKVDMGHNLNTRDVKNLPLVSRNPYNFALLQPGVTGFENPEFGVPRFSANGALLRINYQVDGNTNTQKDRAGLRLLPMSEVMISEVKVVTSGYAPEFGQTTGVVYNAITPSGTNTLKGDVAYRFRRNSFEARPFFLAPTAAKPDDALDIFTADAGGPFKKDKVHYYFGVERTARDMARVITIVPAVASQVGVASQPGAVPAKQTVFFFIGKIDWQLGGSQHLSLRTNTFKNTNPYNASAGGLTALERAADYSDTMYSSAAQLVSTFGANRLNELRVQVAQRHNYRTSSPGAASGPAINISGAINFGGPTSDGQDFKQRITQIVDNFTVLRGSHSYKAGFDFQYIQDHRAVNETATFTFPTIDAYLAAKNGTNLFGYSTFSQTVGVPTFDMTNSLLSWFVQDDWKITEDLKAVYGVRYDFYKYPSGGGTGPNFWNSPTFHNDTNNFSPRVGVAWTLGADRRTVLRASTGIMYDQPLLAIVEQAYARSADPSRITVSLNPTSPGAPAFPSTLSNPPPGYTIPLNSRTIVAMDPNFVTARTVQNNVQLERGLGDLYSMSVGFIYSKGRNLPVMTDINLINPTGTLADGRGIYSTSVNANTRMDPSFNHIDVVQSIGNSTYKALTLEFSRRWSGNIQFDLNYTLGKGVDDAPITSTLAVQGDDWRSDPVNLARDKGPTALDIRHSFNGTIVAQSSVHLQNRVLQALLNDNQVGVILQFNSGSSFTVRGNRDLNRDGVGNDRPLGVGRNSVYLPARYNVDLRYSRFFPLGGNRRVELQGEFKNVFNSEQVSSVNRTVSVDTIGNPLSPIPSDGSGFAATRGYEQRKFQLGFKFYF